MMLRDAPSSDFIQMISSRQPFSNLRLYQRSALYLVLIILPTLSVIPTLPASAQNPVPLTEDKPMSEVLEDLEKRYKLVTGKSSSILDRLAALELQVFGEVKTGSLVDRFQNLQKAPSPDHHESSPQPEPDKAQKRKVGESMTGYIRRLNGDIPCPSANNLRLYRITPVNMTLKGPPDYLDIIMKATKNKVLRFNKMPIPVYITPLRNVQYMKSCVAGFEAWESRTGGKIRFTQVNDPGQARIRVVWKQLGMGKDKDDCALGAHTVTKWKKRGNGKVALMSVGAIPVPLYIPRFGPKYKVPPQVIEVNLDLIDSKVQDVKFLVLQNIVTHELGHALGILGHSNAKSDMMYPITDEHSRISERDLNTVSRLYKLKVDIPL